MISKGESLKTIRARKKRLDLEKLSAFRDAVWQRECVNDDTTTGHCQRCRAFVRRDGYAMGEVHHVIPRSRCSATQRIDPANGILLCAACHRQTHEHRDALPHLQQDPSDR